MEEETVTLTAGLGTYMRPLIYFYSRSKIKANLRQ